MRGILVIICASCLACGSVTSEGEDGGGGRDGSMGIDSNTPGADAVPPDAGLVPLSRQVMAFISDRAGDRDVWLMNLDGSGLFQVTSGTFDDLFASITPEVTRVAFARSSDIWTVNVNGTNLQQLTTDTALDTRPAYSPDGSQIVFTSNRSGSNNIHIMNANGTGQTPVTTGPDSKTFGMFNHDGTKITYTMNNDLFVINTNGTGNTPLFLHTASEATAAFSRDGSKVVFSSNRSGSWELWMGNADGSGAPQMIPTPGNIDPFHASFDYNGTHVIYYANLAGNNNRALFITEIVSGQTVALTNSLTNDQKIGSWIVQAP